MVPVEGVTPARLINSLPCPTFAKSPLGIFEIVPPSYAGRRPEDLQPLRGRGGLLFLEGYAFKVTALEFLADNFR